MIIIPSACVGVHVSMSNYAPAASLLVKGLVIWWEGSEDANRGIGMAPWLGHLTVDQEVTG